MDFKLDRLSDLHAADFDEIIDVRSPAEFAEDHVPGAVNFPVLDNQERARVGTLYKQQSPFAARKVGAALIARNVARHIEASLLDRPGEYRPLIYCWRGGQRSGAMATILGQIGWRVHVLTGGYKSYRRGVVRLLYGSGQAPAEWPWQLILLDGNTGTAKTDLLHRLGGMGAQILDLEGLAGHRGSLFGAMAADQPRQKAFESGLSAAVSRLDPARPVLVEAESSRIGRLNLPHALWEAMQAAPRLYLEAEAQDRARYLVEAYGDIAADRTILGEILDRLRPYHPAARIEAWQALVRTGALVDLARELMRFHYDPKYSRQRAASTHRSLGTLPLGALDSGARQRAARHILDMISGPAVTA